MQGEAQCDSLQVLFHQLDDLKDFPEESPLKDCKTARQAGDSREVRHRYHGEYSLTAFDLRSLDSRFLDMPKLTETVLRSIPNEISSCMGFVSLLSNGKILRSEAQKLRALSV